MLISVVIPTHNRSARLSECLDALLAQDYSDYEIILSDDGSTDNTAQVAAKYPRVKYIRNERRGPAAARNRGLEQARGEIVAFTDDDCRVPPNWLTQLADGYRRYPEVAGIGGYLDPSDEVVAWSIFARYERFITTESYRQKQCEMVGGVEDYPGGGTSNMSYRKKILDEVDNFDEWFIYPAAEDHDLRVRVHALGYKLLYLPLRVEHLRTYSWHSFRKQSITRGRGVVRWEYKSNRRLTSYLLIALRLARRMLQLVPDLVTFNDKRIAIVRWLDLCLDAYGQFLERRELSQSGLRPPQVGRS